MKKLEKLSSANVGLTQLEMLNIVGGSATSYPPDFLLRWEPRMHVLAGEYLTGHVTSVLDDGNGNDVGECVTWSDLEPIKPEV